MAAYVQVPVPKHLVIAVMRFITSQEQTEAQWLRKLWTESKPPIREFLSILAASPGDWVTHANMLLSMNKNTTEASFAGMLGAFGRRCKHRYGGMVPFEKEFDESTHEHKYLMTPEMAVNILALRGNPQS